MFPDITIDLVLPVIVHSCSFVYSVISPKSTAYLFNGESLGISASMNNSTVVTFTFNELIISFMIGTIIDILSISSIPTILNGIPIRFCPLSFIAMLTPLKSFCIKVFIESSKLGVLVSNTSITCINCLLILSSLSILYFLFPTAIPLSTIFLMLSCQTTSDSLAIFTTKDVLI